MEALEISQDQVVCYIPGVGTESFLPLALLDSATGFGVPANVRKLYWFLSWHWEPDCEIYMFGFSRGAFTIRLLVDFIAKEGLLPRIDGSQLVRDQAIQAAWNSYRSKLRSTARNILHKLGFRRLTNAFSFLGQLWTGSSKTVHQQRGSADIRIRFVGLFDTVDALGVPIEEIRRVIHTFLFPISFLDDHTIPRNVTCVRHALSLDDERLTFQPIRIASDEKNESLIPGRVQEVWFAGVHSDVGGGYPDDMSAHVPLVWMLQEAFKAVNRDPFRSLVFHRGALERFDDVATHFGPLHSSRSGVGRIYRWAQRTNVHYDPVGNSYCAPIVHHSVVERLVDSNYDYAPLFITEHFAVWMPDGSIGKPETEMGEWLYELNRSHLKSQTHRQDVYQKLFYAQEALRRLAAPSLEEMDLANTFVWLNRVNYYAYFCMWLVVVLLPFADGPIDSMASWIPDFLAPLISSLNIVPQFQSEIEGLSNVVDGIGQVISSLLPVWLTEHTQAAMRHPMFIATLILTYFALRIVSHKCQYAIRYHVRQAWRIQGEQGPGTAGIAPRALSRLVHHLGNSPARLKMIAITRPILPFVYAFTFLMVPFVVLANRVGFNFLVGRGSVCIESGAHAQWLSAKATRKFSTNDPCWASGWFLERGAPYRLTIDVDPRKGNDDPWLDQLIMTDPYGFDSSGPVLSAAAIFLRRWPSAAWFHPIARIGARGDAEWPLVPLDRSGALSPRGRRCSTLPLNYSETTEHKSFCANHPGAKSCAYGRLSLSIDPLPADELDAAKAAWARDSYNDGKSCNSAFPRTTFVSDFTAQATGELFLFVNDAAHVSLNGRKQIFYDNNTGTATITIEPALSNQGACCYRDTTP
jgi:hypothetical protein